MNFPSSHPASRVLELNRQGQSQGRQSRFPPTTNTKDVRFEQGPSKKAHTPSRHSNVPFPMARPGSNRSRKKAKNRDQPQSAAPPASAAILGIQDMIDVVMRLDDRTCKHLLLHYLLKAGVCCSSFANLMSSLMEEALRRRQHGSAGARDTGSRGQQQQQHRDVYHGQGERSTGQRGAPPAHSQMRGPSSHRSGSSQGGDASFLPKLNSDMTARSNTSRGGEGHIREGDRGERPPSSSRYRGTRGEQKAKQYSSMNGEDHGANIAVYDSNAYHAFKSVGEEHRSSPSMTEDEDLLSEHSMLSGQHSVVSGQHYATHPSPYVDEDIVVEEEVEEEVEGSVLTGASSGLYMESERWSDAEEAEEEEVDDDSNPDEEIHLSPLPGGERPIRPQSRSDSTEHPSIGDEAVSRVECSSCARRFASDRIERHERICSKTSNNKPRKVFDMKKQRVAGTEASHYQRSSGRQASASSSKKQKKNWREDHENFINNIRAAKNYDQAVASGVNPADLPPPEPSQHSDYVECPHCHRKFNQQASIRHMEVCANNVHKPRPPPHLRGKKR